MTKIFGLGLGSFLIWVSGAFALYQDFLWDIGIIGEIVWIVLFCLGFLLILINSENKKKK